MKSLKSLVAFVGIVMLSACGSSTSSNNSNVADFNTDAKDGAVTCTGDGIAKLVLSKDRKSLSIAWEGDEGATQKYKIVDRQSDGDTSVSYTTGGNQSLELDLSDQGDRLVAGHDKYGLKCH